jgi:hypothetical protein
MGVFGGDYSLGEGVNVHPPATPPPRRIARRSPKTYVKKTLAGVPGHAPLAVRVPAPSCTQSVKKTEILNGRTFRVFPHTRMQQCSPIGSCPSRYMYCRSVMCNDKACNVVKCSLNANIHVYVHEDLHEICLLNVKDVQYLLMNVIGRTKI